MDTYKVYKHCKVITVAWVLYMCVANNLLRFQRVISGGHDIPQDIIKRRYQRSLQNLVELYLPLVDRFQAYDNSQNENSLIAYYSHKNSPIKVVQQDIWNQILNS